MGDPCRCEHARLLPQPDELRAEENDQRTTDDDQRCEHTGGALLAGKVYFVKNRHAIPDLFVASAWPMVDSDLSGHRVASALNAAHCRTDPPRLQAVARLFVYIRVTVSLVVAPSGEEPD